MGVVGLWVLIEQLPEAALVVVWSSEIWGGGVQALGGGDMACERVVGASTATTWHVAGVWKCSKRGGGGQKAGADMAPDTMTIGSSVMWHIMGL